MPHSQPFGIYVLTGSSCRCCLVLLFSSVTLQLISIKLTEKLSTLLSFLTHNKREGKISELV